MYFYVDGDNCPGTRTLGISKLKIDDVVKIFYAANNKHFIQESVREELKNRSRCSVEFISVKAGANTVDFAIAVHIAKDCESGKSGQVMCMVSGDKHFDIVKNELSNLYGDIVVNRVESIEEGMMRYYILDIDSASSLKEALELQYGLKTGNEAYEKIIRILDRNVRPVALPSLQPQNTILQAIKELVS